MSKEARQLLLTTDKYQILLPFCCTIDIQSIISDALDNSGASWHVVIYIHMAGKNDAGTSWYVCTYIGTYVGIGW